MAKNNQTAALKRNGRQARTVRRAVNAQNVADAVGEVTRGCEIFGLTNGEFSLVDLIEHVLAATGPADVVCSTWTAAGADITFANRLLEDGAIRSLRFIVDATFPRRQPGYWVWLRAAFGDGAIRVTPNHAKFVLVRNAEWNVVIRTSMNLNENRRLEQFEVSDCPAMAEWLQEFVDALFAERPAAAGGGRRSAAAAGKARQGALAFD